MNDLTAKLRGLALMLSALADQAERSSGGVVISREYLPELTAEIGETMAMLARSARVAYSANP